MRIDTGGLYPNQRATQGGARATGGPAAPPIREAVADNVTVSPGARLLALGRRALEDTPEVRTSVVEAARRRLSGGADACDGRAIARAMIESISGESA